MRRLFRSFERHRVEYLLVSGQASILYGAATFSEDVDIWLEPTVANAGRMLRALASQRARVYKLTPRLTLRNLRFGHGFHFTIPRGHDTVFLDVMGSPPRVGAFREARARAAVVEGYLGPVPVISVPELVEMKKTQRLKDYEVISNLAQSVGSRPDASMGELRWAARNSFRVEDRMAFLERLGRSSSEDACRRRILADIGRFQRADSLYWRRIVSDLRRLHRGGALLETGTPVAELVRRR